MSARELDTAGVPQSSWQATHLTFTHGYGLVMAPTNEKTTPGRTRLRHRGHPAARRRRPSSQIEQPGIYFGEGQSGYVITGTNVDETDFQDEDGEDVPTSYSGADGVGIGSFLRRAAFALRFGDLNPVFSGDLRSRQPHPLRARHPRPGPRPGAVPLLRRRTPTRSSSTAASSGSSTRYTTTDRYPYAQRATIDGLEGTDLDHRFNYIRNSVKVVIDAYDGTVEFYVVDPTDPILQAYRNAFPDLFDRRRAARGDRRPLPVPGGHVPGAVEHVGPLPPPGSRRLLPAERHVGRRPRPRAPAGAGAGDRRGHDDDEPRPTAEPAGPHRPLLRADPAARPGGARPAADPAVRARSAGRTTASS